MQIESVKTIEGGYLVNGSLSVPSGADNRHYQAVMDWIAAGNTPEPADPDPIVIPQIVSMRQAREALIRRGYFKTVDDHIKAMAAPEGDIARNEWDYSQTVERTRPLTLAMGDLLALDAAAMDELFQFAATL
jgi:hypothetical protein